MPKSIKVKQEPSVCIKPRSIRSDLTKKLRTYAAFLESTSRRRFWVDKTSKNARNCVVHLQTTIQTHGTIAKVWSLEHDKKGNLQIIILAGACAWVQDLQGCTNHEQKSCESARL